MADYNITFKLHNMWPIPQNKYKLDRKFLNKDIAYATVDRKRKDTERDMDPLTRLHWFKGVGKANNISMMQLYHNQQLIGALTHQGPMFTKSCIPVNVYVNAKIDALSNFKERLACNFASAMRMVQSLHQSRLKHKKRTGASTETLDILSTSGLGLNPE